MLVSFILKNLMINAVFYYVSVIPCIINKQFKSFKFKNKLSLIFFINYLTTVINQFLLIMLYFGYLALFVVFLKIQSFL